MVSIQFWICFPLGIAGMPFQNQCIGALSRYEINQTFAHGNNICFGIFFDQNLFAFNRLLLLKILDQVFHGN